MYEGIRDEREVVAGLVELVQEFPETKKTIKYNRRMRLDFLKADE